MWDEMKSITYLIFVIYTWHNCIKGTVAEYYLLKGPSLQADAQCTDQYKGNIAIFRNLSSSELIKILHDNINIRIWNGFQYTSNWVENVGCFKNENMLDVEKNVTTDMSIYHCNTYCNGYRRKHFAIRESDCRCLTTSRMTSEFFSPADAKQCSYRCNMRSDEFCGSQKDSPFYNIYSVRKPSLSNTANISLTQSCLLYKWEGDRNKTAYRNCNEKVMSTDVACRLLNGAVERIFNKSLTWTESVNTCINRMENSSYLVSYFAIRNMSSTDRKNFTTSINAKHGRIWLNERKYTTIVERKKNDEESEICQILSNGLHGNLTLEQQLCSDSEDIVFVCKTDHLDEKTTTSTVPYPNSRKSSSTVATSTKKSSDDHLDEKTTTSNVPFPNSRKSSSTLATSTKKRSDGITITDWSISTFHPPRNGSTEMRLTLTETMESDDGSIIGGVIGTLVVILVTGCIVIFIVRKRQQGSCKDDSDYQSQKVNYSKCNGLTNMAYCSEATLNIIQGNPDRISQEYTTIKDEFRNSQEYTTIQDEKLQNIRVSNSESDTFENKNHSSPTNGSLYMVLEETHSKSEICNPPNYELAQPISSYGGKENASLHPDGREQKEGAMDYDHLRQEAYKQNMAEENVYNHAETDNDYSHISQVAKTNKNHTDENDDDNDYDHTGYVQNHEQTSNSVNDKYDTYAHAGGDSRTVDDQIDDDDDDDYAHTHNKESHHQTSIMRIDQDDTYAHAGGDGTNADGIRDVGPYDLAQNVYRPDDDSKEYSDNIRGNGPYELAHNVNRPDVDDQKSSNDMREIGRYELAHNIDRRENGAMESPQDTFVQHGTEEGNYSLAEPIDMNDSGQYE